MQKTNLVEWKRRNGMLEKLDTRNRPKIDRDVGHIIFMTGDNPKEENQDR